MTKYNLSLKKIISPTLPTAIFLIVACLSLWLVADLSGQELKTVENYNGFINLMEFNFERHLFFGSIITILITLVNAFLLAQLNSQYTLIRTRTFLPILTFMILMSAWNETHLLSLSHFALTLLIIALFFLLHIQKDNKSVEQAFMGSFAIGIASILINPLLFLIPFFWIAIVLFQSFSLRTFLASTFGILCPWILYIASYLYFHPNNSLEGVIQTDYSIGMDFISIPLPTIIYIAALAAVFLITIAGMYANSHGDAIQTRIRINALVILLFALIVLTFIFAQQAALFLPLVAFIYALLVSHTFSLKENTFFSTLFIIFCILNIAFVIYKLIAI